VILFNRSSGLVVGLALLGLATHLVPHDMGVSTVGAIGLLSAAYLPKHLLIVPLLVTIVVADLYSGGYAWQAMTVVYLAHGLAAFAVAPILKRVGFTTVGMAAVVSACVFYLVSNVTPMVMGYYDNTWVGWVSCYINGLPYLLRGILANAIFAGVAFGVIRLLSYRNAHRLATP